MNGIKPAWPETVYTDKKKGKRDSQKNIQRILDDKARRTRRGEIAELLGIERRKIAETKQARDQRLRERAAITAIAETMPDMPLKIVRSKKGEVSLKPLKRGEKGKFLPSIKVNA